MSGCRSISPAKTVTRNVRTYYVFFYGIRFSLENAILTGEGDVIIIRDLRESAQGRGRAVPAAAQAALSTWGDALGLALPLDNHTLSVVTPTG